MRERQRALVEIPGLSAALRYQTRIEAVLSDRLLLASPLFAGRTVPLAVGTRVSVTVYDHNESQAFESIVLDQRDEPVPVVVLQRPERLMRVQRRRFFREAAVLPVLCRGALDGALVEGLTLNLSGGGLLMRTLQLDPLAGLLEGQPAGEPLEVDVMLPDRPLQGRGAMRWWRIDDTQRQCDLAFEFLGMLEDERERLIRFLFSHQREALRKVVTS